MLRDLLSNANLDNSTLIFLAVTIVARKIHYC